MTRRHGATLAALTATVVLAASACSGTPASGAAVDAATRFYAAVADGDGAAACALLLPDAAESAAADEDATCAEAVTSGEIGDELSSRAGGLGEASAHVAGRQAQVLFAADTVFLTRSGSGWVVTAAGCDARPGRPYDCEVQA
ncbi:hypothetical protein GC089_00495 [Cellulomonas sp. JZ18]|uniref:hypothetical protein n=1 Tax=Cellulomonas sp. JZ18 TaxID=2654191 RepID=UPI0012D4BE88|nr:hypothetical protein [Cellulomonas sp. JZ18]QGQ18023.1 hypothetical protein GC089_00495 [Cellulomonas sp. JZ18]